MITSPHTKFYRYVKPVYVFTRRKFPLRVIWVKLIFPAVTWLNIFRFRNRENRKLEIGADFRNPIEGFETLGIYGDIGIDYTLDASKRMPFVDDSFELIFASHVLEHIPWYQSVDVLSEWRRILEPGGSVEIWVPDGLKISQNVVDVETGAADQSHLDGYYNLVRDDDPRIWASLRMFTFGDGTGLLDHPNWHRAMFTPSLLLDTLKWAGFERTELLDNSQVRGRDHGWINLGARGFKP